MKTGPGRKQGNETLRAIQLLYKKFITTALISSNANLETEVLKKEVEKLFPSTAKNQLRDVSTFSTPPSVVYYLLQFCLLRKQLSHTQTAFSKDMNLICFKSHLQTDSLKYQINGHWPPLF